MLRGAAPLEREGEGEAARTQAQLVQRRADRAGQPVDDEEQPLRVAQRVVGPLERRVRQGAGDRVEEDAQIVGARQPPERHAEGAEAHLHRLQREAGEVAAGLEPGGLEHRAELGRRLEHGEREGGEPGALLARRHFDQVRLAVHRRDLGGDRDQGEPGARAGGSLEVERLEQRLGERARGEPARVGPDARARHADPGNDRQQRGGELSGARRAGRSGRDPETDEGHRAIPVSRAPCARAIPTRAPPLRW